MDEHPRATLRQEWDDPFAPIVFNRRERCPATPFKVVVFNACGCPDPQAVAERLSRPPLAGAAAIFLSEADCNLRRSRWRKCAAELAERLSMSYAYSPEFTFNKDDRHTTGFFGNAILSASRLENVRTVPLPIYYHWSKKRLPGTTPGTRRVGQRGGMMADVNLAGRRVTLALAHLENRASPQARAHQMAQFLSALPAGGPGVIGGDFNTATVNVLDWRACAAIFLRLAVEPRRLRRPEPYEPLFGLLEQTGFEYREANAALEPTYTPFGLIPPFLRAKLDWIALRELKVVPGSARVARARSRWFQRISDHDFVVCEFAF